MDIDSKKTLTKLLIPVGFLSTFLIEYLLTHFLDYIGFINRVTVFFSKVKLFSFLNYLIPLWEVILFVIILGIISYLLFKNRVVFKIKKTRQEKFYDLIDEFKVSFKYMEGKTGGVQYKTDLTMSNENIILQNIEPYCLCHKPKLKMVCVERIIDVYKVNGYRCPDDECGNSVTFDSVEDDKHILLSRLEYRWDKSIKEMN